MTIFAESMYTDMRVHCLSSYTFTKKNITDRHMLKISEERKYYTKVYNQNGVETGWCDAVRGFIVLLPL